MNQKKRIELWARNEGPVGLDHEINLDGEFKNVIGYFFFAKL